tara:strand:- start:1306 stop:1593 length:288 start_codon:yes stop_codon:yes gene_type:complete
MQAQGTGKSKRVRLDRVSARDVISKKQLKVLSTPLRDWLACSECRHQQLHHAQNGGDFDSACWNENCGADSSHFMYMDELAKELNPNEFMYRFKL